MIEKRQRTREIRQSKIMGLNLDLSLDFVPKTVPEILCEVSSITDCSTKRLKLDDYVKRLEDEMRKIDAFKRELPLCVLLLRDAILRLKEEMNRFQSVIEEFIPLKGNSDEIDGENEEKKNKWLSSTELWNKNSKSDVNSSYEEDNSDDCGKKQQRAFELFKDQSNFARKEDIEFSEIPKLTLMTPISVAFPVNLTVTSGAGAGSNGRAVSGLSSSASQVKEQSKLTQQHQAIRKQRRCWSPELHRRFIDALHRLGGSQVATPKQIRELMQVDGLTNDEVKSHLQKYRLHVRKLAPSEGQDNEVWMSEKQCVDDDDHHHHLHQPKTSCIIHTTGSPDGPLHPHHVCRSAKALSLTEGDSMEGEDDSKSDSHSWRGGIQTHHKLRNL